MRDPHRSAPGWGSRGGEEFGLSNLQPPGLSHYKQRSKYRPVSLSARSGPYLTRYCPWAVPRNILASLLLL